MVTNGIFFYVFILFELKKIKVNVLGMCDTSEKMRI